MEIYKNTLAWALYVAAGSKELFYGRMVRSQAVGSVIFKVQGNNVVVIFGIQDMSLDKAKLVALEHARIKAIADTYGTFVGMTDLIKTNEKSLLCLSNLLFKQTAVAFQF